MTLMFTWTDSQTQGNILTMAKQQTAAILANIKTRTKLDYRSFSVIFCLIIPFSSTTIKLNCYVLISQLQNEAHKDPAGVSAKLDTSPHIYAKEPTLRKYAHPPALFSHTHSLSILNLVYDIFVNTFRCLSVCSASIKILWCGI